MEPCAPQKKTIEVQPWPRKQCINFLIKVVVFNIPDLVHGPTAATAHYNSKLLVSFNFVLPRKPKMPLNVSRLGLNIIYFISNLYGGVFFTELV